MKIRIRDLEVGDRLTANVFNNYGLHVMSSGTVTTKEDIDKLYRHKIDYVDIEMRENFEIQHEADHSADKMLKIVQPKYDDAVSGMKLMFEQVTQEGKFEESIVDQSFEPLLEHFEKERDVVSLLLSLTNNDDYTFQHCVQVGMISYYIAKWIELSEQEALLIGKAGYLHDIGKCQIDSAILSKPGPLTEEEFSIIKNHTTLGHSIIRKSFPHIGEISLVALQHHERLNGTGYPQGLTGGQIHLMSKIVAIADIYSAMISSRVYQKKRDLLVVLKELYRLSFSELEPAIVQTFIQRMIPNFIGKRLIMKSGEVGRIIMTNPTDPFRPLIRIGDNFIDLSKESKLEIETIYV